MQIVRIHYSCIWMKQLCTFEAKAKSTVLPRGATTIHDRASGSINIRMTVCFSIPADETKLRLFVIFKPTPDGHIEKSLKPPSSP